MRILHYALGFPPYRSGGLTEYAIDLAKEESRLGNKVGILWPGKITSNPEPFIKKKLTTFGIDSYEMINPLPVPLLNGILATDLYSQRYNPEIFKNFLLEIHPDVIHFHTLMGLPMEFVQVAHDMKIRTIFTTHDYFGLCFKVNLLYQGKICENWDNCVDCYDCNQTALPFRTIQMMQSPIYRLLKNSSLMRILRKRKKRNVQKENVHILSSAKNSAEYSSNYKKLRAYYINILSLIDVIHFNSSLAQSIYFRFFSPKNYVTIPILHANIKDNRIIKQFNLKLKIAYLGPASEYKGYYLLVKVLDEIYRDGYTNFELSIFNQSSDIRPYIVHHQPYLPQEISEVFADIDLLVVPSLWYETYGFVVPEALSCGVPIIVTTNVGAKDIINSKIGMIVKPDLESIKKAIITIYKNRNKLVNINFSIVENRNLFFDFNKHVLQILDLYERR